MVTRTEFDALVEHVAALQREIHRFQVILLKLRGLALGQLPPNPRPLDKKGQ